MTNREIIEKLERSGVSASIDRYHDGKYPIYCLIVYKNNIDFYRVFDFNNMYDLKKDIEESIIESHQEVEKFNETISRQYLELEKEVYKILFERDFQFKKMKVV